MRLADYTLDITAWGYTKTTVSAFLLEAARVHQARTGARTGWYEVIDVQDLRRETKPRVRVHCTDSTVGNLGWFAVWGADMDQVLIAGPGSLIKPQDGKFRIDSESLKRWSINEGNVVLKPRLGVPS